MIDAHRHPLPSIAAIAAIAAHCCPIAAIAARCRPLPSATIGGNGWQWKAMTSKKRRKGHHQMASNLVALLLVGLQRVLPIRRAQLERDISKPPGTEC